MNTLNSNTHKPFGEMTIQHLFGLEAIHNVGNRSTTWQVIEAFVRQNEAVASRISFGTSGAIVMTTIPGDPTSGMFYLYDARTKAFFMVDFERQNNFTPTWFDITMVAYGLDRLISFPVENVPSHHGHRRGHRNHRSGRRLHLTARSDRAVTSPVAA